MVSSLDSLPEEVLHSVLYYCHPATSAALAQAARRFRRVADEPLLWRFYCQTHFKHWDHEHNLLDKLARPVPSVNWKALYISRHLVDRATSRLLDSILASQTGRLEKIQMVIDLGFDIKDTLLRHGSVGPDTEDYLARRYYAQEILTLLQRSIAIAEWAKLRIGEPVSLERALGAFDLFIPEQKQGGLDEMKMKLDEIASQFIADVPGIGQLTPREKALVTASYLRTNDLTGIEPGREYHLLEHNFLGIALNDAGHNSLPLISAAIYCYIAQRLGLDARPCGFPFHVHVIVMPPLGFDMDGNTLDGTGQGEPMYMDPFRSQTETHVSNLQNQLALLGASNIEQSNFLGESRTSQIVLRCGKNILTSIQHMYRLPGTHSATLDSTNAKYAALWSSMLLSDPNRQAEIRHYLPWLINLLATEFPLDVYLVEKYLTPLFNSMPEHGHILKSLHVMRTVDKIPKQVRRRVPENKNVKYWVGQVFRHRRYYYRAIITGWDAECGADEHWMIRMGIDRLQAGRHQSFYHVLVEDRTVRYVAEENIELIASPFSELPRSLISIAGRHFKQWDGQTQSFVSNIRDEYPND